MISIDGKEYRNIQEQVEKNMEDIEDLESKTVNIIFNSGSKAKITFKENSTFEIYVENDTEDGFTYSFAEDGIYLDGTKITN